MSDSDWNDAIEACAQLMDNADLAEQLRAIKRPEASEPRPISEVSIPAAEVINMPCKGCGKRPIDFIT